MAATLRPNVDACFGIARQWLKKNVTDGRIGFRLATRAGEDTPDNRAPFHLCPNGQAGGIDHGRDCVSPGRKPGVVPYVKRKVA